MRVLLPLLAVVMLSPTLGAVPDDPECDGGMGIVTLSAGTPESTYYVDDRNAVTGNGVYVYQESNGVWYGPTHKSLQRGGASPYFTIHDLCVDDPLVDPDTLVW